MKDQLQTKLEQTVKRSYTIGARFEGATREKRRQNELRANDIIKELQQTIGDIITPRKMDETLKFVRLHKKMSGTQGAAKLATHFKNRSNLGQVAYVTMLAAANGTLDRECKIRHFCTFLQEEKAAAVEWLVFGRTPYLEWKLQHQLKVAYDYSRNLIHSARRTLDPHLPAEHKLLSSLPEMSRKDIIAAIEQFFHSIEETFAKQAKQAKDEKLSAQQKNFLKKLILIHHHRQLITEAIYRWLIEWNNLIVDPPLHLSRWRQFKQFTRGVEEWVEIITEKKIKRYSYLSVLRGCLVSALFPLYHEGETVKELMKTGIICPEHLIAKPFREKSCSRRTLIPLSLLMGRKYVVGRPGSSTVMTELASKDGGFSITIWPPRRKKERIVAQLRFHRRIREMLSNGVKLTLLILRSTPGPSGKILIDLVLEGQYWMFLSKRRLKTSSLKIQQPIKPVKGIGLDINRVSSDMLAYSEEVTLPDDIQSAIRHYLHLENVLKQLHRRLTALTNLCDNVSSSLPLVQYEKLKQELTLVYARRARLLKALHRLSCSMTAQVLYQTKSPVLCVEDLLLVARGTRGALAKAILNMPDEIDLYERAILLVFYLTGTAVVLHRVDPRHTSQGVHVGCSVDPTGHIVRSRDTYDLAPCSACGILVNTHHNAACLIRDKGLLQLSSS